MESFTSTVDTNDYYNDWNISGLVNNMNIMEK